MSQRQFQLPNSVTVSTANRKPQRTPSNKVRTNQPSTIFFSTLIEHTQSLKSRTKGHNSVDMSDGVHDNVLLLLIYLPGHWAAQCTYSSTLQPCSAHRHRSSAMQTQKYVTKQMPVFKNTPQSFQSSFGCAVAINRTKKTKKFYMTTICFYTFIYPTMNTLFTQ